LVGSGRLRRRARGRDGNGGCLRAVSRFLSAVGLPLLSDVLYNTLPFLFASGSTDGFCVYSNTDAADTDLL
jgi:hypothetical protein